MNFDSGFSELNRCCLSLRLASGKIVCIFFTVKTRDIASAVLEITGNNENSNLDNDFEFIDT